MGETVPYDWLAQARKKYPKAPEKPPSYEDFQNLRSVVGALINHLAEQQSRADQWPAGQRTTVSPTTASPLVVLDTAFTEARTPPSQHPLGDLTEAERTHVAQCFWCRDRLAQLVWLCLTPAQAASGTETPAPTPSTSVRLGTGLSAASSGAAEWSSSRFGEVYERCAALGHPFQRCHCGASGVSGT